MKAIEIWYGFWYRKHGGAVINPYNVEVTLDLGNGLSLENFSGAL